MPLLEHEDRHRCNSLYVVQRHGERMLSNGILVFRREREERDAKSEA